MDARKHFGVPNCWPVEDKIVIVSSSRLTVSVTNLTVRENYKRSFHGFRRPLVMLRYRAWVRQVLTAQTRGQRKERRRMAHVLSCKYNLLNMTKKRYTLRKDQPLWLSPYLRKQKHGCCCMEEALYKLVGLARKCHTF